MTEQEIITALKNELARLDQLRECSRQSRVTRALARMTESWIEHLEIALAVARRGTR